MFPNDELLRLRVDLRRFAPRRQILAKASNTPRTKPGKNPTRTAPMGNLSHSLTKVALQFRDDAGNVAAGNVGIVVEIEIVVEVDLAVEEETADFVVKGLVEDTPGAML